MKKGGAEAPPLVEVLDGVDDGLASPVSELDSHLLNDLPTELVDVAKEVSLDEL